MSNQGIAKPSPEVLMLEWSNTIEFLLIRPIQKTPIIVNGY